MGFTIDKDVPIPDYTGKGRPPKYKHKLGEMEVGDSFEVGQSHRDAVNCRGAIAYYYSTTDGEGKRFIVRHVGNNIWRCWRVK